MSDSGGFAPPPPPPPSAGGGGSIPQRGLGDLLSTAFEVYRANAAKLIQIVAIVVIPLTFIQALLLATALKQSEAAVTINQATGEVTITNGGGLGRSLLILALTWFISIAIQQLLTGALTVGGAGSLVGRAVDVGGSYRYALSRLGGLLILAFLIALVVGLGFILLIIPGVIFAVFLSMAVPAFIVERKTATDSMSRSWGLVSGSWWHVLGVIVVAALIAGVINGILGAIGGNTFVLRWIFSTIGQLITAPFVALVSVLLYVDLRVRREGLDGTTLSHELDQTTA
jgi:hypothetical protein